MRSVTMFLVVETQSSLIPTGLLTMRALEEAKGFTRQGLFGSFADPFLECNIVCEEEGGRYGSWACGAESMAVVVAT